MTYENIEDIYNEMVKNGDTFYDGYDVVIAVLKALKSLGYKEIVWSRYHTPPTGV